MLMLTSQGECEQVSDDELYRVSAGKCVNVHGTVSHELLPSLPGLRAERTQGSRGRAGLRMERK